MTRPKSIGVFAGSFDPITLGHLDLIKRSLNIFDHVHVVVGISDVKNYLFSTEERTDMISALCEGMPHVTVASHAGLTTDYAAKVGAGFLIRGVRSPEDLSREQTMAQMNLELLPGIETILLSSKPTHIHISSTLVKEVARFGGSLMSLVPAAVSDRVVAKIRIRDPRP